MIAQKVPSPTPSPVKIPNKSLKTFNSLWKGWMLRRATGGAYESIQYDLISAQGRGSKVQLKRTGVQKAKSKNGIKSALNFAPMFLATEWRQCIPFPKAHPHKIGNILGQWTLRPKAPPALCIPNQQNWILGWAILSPTFKVNLGTYLLRPM